MFLKQYNYKPRSNSQSSGGDNSSNSNSNSSNNKDNNSSTTPGSPITGLNDPSSNPAIQARRRSSASERYAGLNNYKRSSQDEGSSQRKAAYAEQKPGSPGVLGSMWQSFTKGSN